MSAFLKHHTSVLSERSRYWFVNWCTTICMHLMNMITYSTDVLDGVCDWWPDTANNLITCAHGGTAAFFIFYVLHVLFASIWYLFTVIV